MLVSRVLASLVAVVTGAVLMGCGHPDERIAELPARAGEESDALLFDAEESTAGDAVINGAATDDGIASNGLRDDPVEAGKHGVDDDAVGDAGVGDDSGAGDGARVGAGVVVDGGGGLLVVDVCGWPGPLCPADESVASIDEGGRLWRGPTSPADPRSQWVPWAGRVLDLCDAHEALVAVDGEYWDRGGGGIDYGAELDGPDIQRVRAYRERHAVVCSPAEAAIPKWECPDGNYLELQAHLEQFVLQPRPSEVLAWAESMGFDCLDASTLGRRYVYVTIDGPSVPRASVEATVEAYRQAVESYASRPSDFAPGEPLGYWGTNYVVEAPQDALVVLPSSVSVIDGVVRGLAQNHSERLWARNVTVTATDPAGVEHTWRFPLAVQPGEPVPFEIEGWTGSQPPSEIALAVSAEMSPTIDLTRSLDLTWSRYYRTVEELLHLFPEAMVGTEILDGEFSFVEVLIQREAPTAQARLAPAALDQPIENLVVYAATLNGEVVSDVFELTPMVSVYLEEEPEPEWIEVSGIGIELPGIGPIGAAIVGALLEYPDKPLIWAGGAAKS